MADQDSNCRHGYSNCRSTECGLILYNQKTWLPQDGLTTFSETFETTKLMAGCLATAANQKVPDELVELWKKEQLDLKQKLVTHDSANWMWNNGQFSNLNLIGGVDLSFPKGDNSHACVCLVVLTFPELEVVYEDLKMVHLSAPYVPEFLAFREAEYLEEVISHLKEKDPGLLPQVILVDGNGMLHPREFGLACHLGVLIDMPTIGVAKKLFHVDGIEKGEHHTEQIQTELKKGGDSFPLVGTSGKTWGAALKSTSKCTNPIYVSIGHRVGLQTATSLVHACCSYRVPEPTRQADIRSREFIRQNYSEMLQDCVCKTS